MPYAVEVERLTKTFYPPKGLLRLISKSPLKRKLTAVDDVSLRVQEGEVFGLLGPNGAGKTTLIKMLCALIQPTSGRALIHGIDAAKEEDRAKQLIGLVTTDERSFFWRLTGRENLDFFAALYNLSRSEARQRVDRSLEQVGLTEAADNMFYGFSSGMKQKLGIARALLTDPKLLFLDEPTRSLDPIAAQGVKELIRHTFADNQGRTIFLSTHRLDEAEQLCDRIAIMDRGRVIFVGSVAELRKRIRRKEKYIIEVGDFSEARLDRAARKRRFGDISLASINGSRKWRLEFHALEDDRAVSHLLAEVIADGGHVISCYKEQCSLEDLFVDLVRGNDAVASQ